MKTLGQIGYDIYGEIANWITYDGKSMPSWDDLSNTDAGKETQRRWQTTVMRLLDEECLATAQIPEGR
jgi:hypothetical protein